MQFIYIIILLSLPFAANSKTTWPESALNIIKNFNYPFSNSYAGTVWSSCASRKDNNLKLEGRLVEKSFPNSYFDNNKFEITFILQEEGELIKKAPTIILINGLFGNPLSGVARQLAKILLESGYNIIALGNPLGPKNIAQKPRYDLGNFLDEGKAFYLNVKNAVGWMKKNDLIQGKIDLLSVSYGSFVGSIIKALDQQENTPVMNGVMTLLSPAMEMDIALYNMDDILVESKKVGKLADWMIMFKSIRHCYLPIKEEPSQKQLETLKAIFSYIGFQRWLADQTIVIDKLYDLGKVPVDKKERIQWRRTFSFRDYLKNFSPELKDLMSSEKGELRYWLNQIPKSQYRIFTTLDDPLNKGIEHRWSNFSNLASIKKGGHYGLRAFPFFTNFLKELYRN